MPRGGVGEAVSRALRGVGWEVRGDQGRVGTVTDGRYAHAEGAAAYRCLLKVLIDCTLQPEMVRKGVGRPISQKAVGRPAEANVAMIAMVVAVVKMVAAATAA